MEKANKINGFMSVFEETKVKTGESVFILANVFNGIMTIRNHGGRREPSIERALQAVRRIGNASGVNSTLHTFQGTYKPAGACVALIKQIRAMRARKRAGVGK